MPGARNEWCSNADGDNTAYCCYIRITNEGDDFIHDWYDTDWPHFFAPGEDEWECDVKGDGCLRPEEGRADSEAAETCWISTGEGLDWCACATCAAADHGHPHPLRLRWTL